MHFPIEIPCKPAVRQFLLNKYGAEMNIPNSDLVKKMLFNLLHRNTAKDEKDITLQYYTTSVTINLTLDQALRFGLNLSKTAIREMNTTIEEIIYERLHVHMEFFVYVSGYKEKAAIEMFQHLYNFPEEVLAFDTIKKHYQRHIQPNLYVNKIVGGFVPQNNDLLSTRKKIA